MNKFNKKIFAIPQIFAKNFTFTIHHFLGTSSHTHKEMIVGQRKSLKNPV